MTFPHVSTTARLLGLISAAGASALISMPAAAHGAPDYPISREYNCFKNPSQSACKAAIAFGGEQAIYDWNGVNQAFAGGNHRAVVPDGTLCAGGQTKFKGFDLPRSDWQATVWSPGSDGRYEFRYNATAPHRTSTWQFYITRDGWNPAAGPLKWSDLDLISTINESEVDRSVTNRYTMRVTVPKRTGHHVLYAAWQRSDSTEAFYSCSDVSFGGTTATTPTTNPTPPVAPTTLSPLGQVVAQQDLPANASVKLRVFGAQGADLEAISLSVTAANGARANWLSQLATLVNSSSAYVRLGNAVGNTVSVPTNVNSMQLYALAGQNGLNFAVDIALPTTPVTTPVTTPPATPTKPPVAAGSGWVEGGSYKVGQVVSYKGVNYVCLQAHTAWRGAGWYPDVAGVLDILWKRV